MSIDDQGFLSPDVEPFQKTIRERHKEFFDLFERVSRMCHRRKYDFTIHSKDGQEVFAGALFLKLLTDTEAVVILLERGMASQGRSMLRVAIECAINLAKICTTYEFVQAYVLTGERQRLQLVKGIRNNPEIGFDAVLNEITDDLIEGIVKNLAESKREKIEDWAADVNLSWMYHGPYRVFCPDVHSGPAALDRYLVFDAEGTELETYNVGPQNAESIPGDLMLVTRLLIEGITQAAKVFQISVAADLQPIQSEYERLGRLAPSDLPS